MASVVVSALGDIVSAYRDNNNLPLVGGMLLTQSGGVNYATYVEPTGTIPNTNPIILNNRGEIATSSGTSIPLYVQQNVAYTFTLFDALGNQIWATPAITAPVTLAEVQSYFTESVIGGILYPQTPAELAANVTPINFYVPSHLATGEVSPLRYGAVVDGVTDDTVAINNAFSVATQAFCDVVLSGGTSIVSNLIFGTQSITGASKTPAGIRGQGSGANNFAGATNGSILKAKLGTTGTLLACKGSSGIFLRNFCVDCLSIVNIGIDTSWGTQGTNNYNQYEGIIVQGYLVNGWLAINDNQSKFKDLVARQESNQNFGLSGIRIEGSGGGFFLDNVTCSSDYLSITCQNCEIHGGYSFGIRFNESQTGVNYIAMSGGTQIYANPSRPISAHFVDTHTIGGSYVTSIVATGLYLLAASGTAQTVTFDCSLGGKSIFNGCAFIFGSSTGNWNLYSSAYIGAISPTTVEYNGCTMGAVINNPPTGTISMFKEITNASAVLSDYPARVVYRHTIPFVSGLTVNTWTNIIPSSAMTEGGATYMLSVLVNATGADNLACGAIVSTVGRTASTGPTTAIAQGTTVNINNNLTNAITLRYSATVAGYAGIDAQVNIALAANSTIYVNLLRMSNPFYSY